MEKRATEKRVERTEIIIINVGSGWQVVPLGGSLLGWWVVGARFDGFSEHSKL